MANKIKRVNAEYTGGCIYVYSGELENGTFFLFSDDWGKFDYVMFLNANPDETEESEYYDWQEAHKTGELYGENAKTFARAAIRKAIKELKNGVSMNAAQSELERRLNW